MHTPRLLTCAMAPAALAMLAAVLAPHVNGAPFPQLATCGAITVSRTGRLMDGCGRERNFRGVNVVVKSPPYHPNVVSWQQGQSVVAADAELWQSAGWNAVRQGTMWSGVQPTPGGFNATYLAVMTNLTAMLASQYDVYTLVSGRVLQIEWIKTCWVTAVILCAEADAHAHSRVALTHVHTCVRPARRPLSLCRWTRTKTCSLPVSARMAPRTGSPTCWPRTRLTSPCR
jgi:hypothetical protein